MEKSMRGGSLGRKLLAVFAFSLILLVIGGWVIHNRLINDANDTEATIGDNGEAFELPGMILKADPNPVPSGPERVKTTISWNAPGHRVVQIFVGPPGSGGEKLFVEYGGRGSAEVDFVVPDQQYEFRMYGGKDKKELLAVLRIPKK